MPHINRIRVNNVKYNFGTQMYDDFMLKPFGRNMLYDLANGGGKSVLMLLMLQTIIPNCTLDEKQPVEKLFRTGDGSQTIHSLIEWRLDPSADRGAYRFMTAGFCARKASQEGKEGEEAKDTASIEYFNYCIFYKDYNDADIRNLPLVKNGEKITYNGLRRYLKDLEKNPSLEVRIFDRKGEYQRFLSRYGIYESTWELIRGINKTEGHVRTYFETNYRTTRKVVEDLLIEEIIQKSFLQKTDGADAEDSMAKTLLDMKDQLMELSKRREEMGRFDSQAAFLNGFAEQSRALLSLYAEKEEQETELLRTYEGAKYYYESRLRDCEERKTGIEELEKECYELERKLACARLCGDKNRAAQMVLEIELLAGGLETIRNRQARETLTLQQKESMNDYLEYQAEKMKRDEIAEAIRAMQDKNSDLNGELKLLTWHMKKRMDAKKERLEKELSHYEAEKDKKQAQADQYAEESRAAERREAVLESRIADRRAERKARLERMAAYKVDAGILLAEEAQKTGEQWERTLAQWRQEEAQLKKDAAGVSEMAAAKRALLAGVRARCGELKKDQQAAAEYAEEYQKKRGQVIKYLRIYKRETLPEVLAAIKEKEREAVCEELALARKKEQCEDELAGLRDGRWVVKDDTLEKLAEYIHENWRGHACTGAEYLGGLSGEQQKRLLAKYPYLPFSLIAGEEYERLAQDEEVRRLAWLKGCVPVLRKELLEREEDMLCRGRMFLLSEDKAMFLSPERVEEEIARLSSELVRLEESLRRIAERKEACAEDAGMIQEFLLRWEPNYETEQKKAEACRTALEALQAELAAGEREEEALRSQEEVLTKKAAELTEACAEKEAAAAACRALAAEYEEYRKAENLLSEEEAEYRAAAALLEEGRAELTACRERVKELTAVCEGRKESLAAMERDWTEKYSTYYEEGTYKEIRYTDEELEARLNGRRMAAMQGNAELEDKNRLVNSYISAMNRCLRSITARGISVADLTERFERNELYATKEEELEEARKGLHDLAKEIASKEKALELLRADWNRLDGRNQQAAEEIRRVYGLYEEMDLTSEAAEEFLQATGSLIDRKRAELNGAKLAYETAKEAIRDYEDVKKDIERMSKSAGIELKGRKEGTFGVSEDSEELDLREHFKEVENRYDRLLKRLTKEQERFYRSKEELMEGLKEQSAHPLAEEIRVSVTMPANAQETTRMITGLAQIVECLNLEKGRIESGTKELQSMKENFENQCLQRCMNIRTELERLPRLSKIMLDGVSVPIISLTIPYVKEEFFRERMAGYIDEVIEGADKVEDERDRLRYIRAALAWKKLFSVIVTDMNAIRLTLYKRERVKEQSRHLRYEEAVGSTGQSQGIYIQFLIAVINYIASINSPEGDTAELTKVLFIDNPFGAAKDVYIWEPIFELLKTNRVQLIVPARGTTPAITGRFDVNYVLGQKLVDGRQLTVVTDYVSRVDTKELEYVPLRYEQASFDIF
ncbi:MAG: hypothetical protein J6B85_12595 [Lachnospiraceae bacterium]|nr:hypothetical protein [Lachnospiraceae bacterium]